jgi:hypothetical protein
MLHNRVELNAIDAERSLLINKGHEFRMLVAAWDTGRCEEVQNHPGTTPPREIKGLTI